MQGTRWILIIGVGQLISVTLAMTGIFSTNLTERGFVFPVLQSTGFYFLLSLYLLKWPFPLKIPEYLYGLLALLDVEANYLAVLAYQYTDITSVLLFNSLTIPWVVILSYFVLKKRYTWMQIGAVVLCIMGLALVIVSDTLRGRWEQSDSQFTKAWVGDLICVGSSLLYACQNVLQEYMLKRLQLDGFGSNSEYLGMLGLCGLVISNIQWLILDRGDLIAAGSSLWSSAVMGYFIGFSLIMVFLYQLLSWYIGRFDASLFNMSILTSGVYGLLLEVLQGKATARSGSDWMYIVAYALVVAGVCLYSLYQAPVHSKLQIPLSDETKSST